jgi:hypothetical protein
MKLGICYMVFDGEELLEFAARSIRSEADHISVTYQSVSYFGNPADPSLLETLLRLQSMGLVDELIHYETDLSIHHKDNELQLRNIGLEASRRAGCTHHISFDVDEFVDPVQLAYAKKEMEGDYNYSVVRTLNYYKDPTYLVWPEQTLFVSFIHPVHNEYSRTVEYPTFPFHMETTRRFSDPTKPRLFSREECVIHHMSYIRRDIRKKFANSDNARFYKLEKFYSTFENYKLGGRVCLLPDYLNRKTILVENRFGIRFD